MACLWYAVGSHPPGSNSWLDLVGTQAETASSLQRYLLCVYWSLQTVTTTGYGDISATNIPECLCTVLIIVTGDCLFGGVIGSISVRATQLNMHQSNFNKQFGYVNDFLRMRHVRPELCASVRKYYHFLDVRNLSFGNQAAPLLEMPYALRCSVAFTMYRKFLYAVPFFSGVDQHFMGQLCSLVQSQIFLKGDNIVTIGDVGDHLFVLTKGKVMIFIYNTDLVNDHVSLEKKIVKDAPGHFGESGVLTRSLRSASVRALTHCFTLTLSKRDLDPLLEKNPHYAKSIYNSFLAHAKYNYIDVPHSEPGSMEPGAAVANASRVNGNGLSIFNALSTMSAPANDKSDGGGSSAAANILSEDLTPRDYRASTSPKVSYRPRLAAMKLPSQKKV
jgi:CRP-like cAMP-binding protein